MAITELLPVAATQGSASTPRTVGPGAFERVGLKGATTNSVPDGARAEIQVATDTGLTVFEVHALLLSDAEEVTKIIPGPCSYRVVRAAGNVGVYAET